MATFTVIRSSSPDQSGEKTKSPKTPLQISPKKKKVINIEGDNVIQLSPESPMTKHSPLSPSP